VAKRTHNVKPPDTPLGQFCRPFELQKVALPQLFSNKSRGGRTNLHHDDRPAGAVLPNPGPWQREVVELPFGLSISRLCLASGFKPCFRHFAKGKPRPCAIQPSDRGAKRSHFWELFHAAFDPLGNRRSSWIGL